jgi:hypothetical protein
MLMVVVVVDPRGHQLMLVPSVLLHHHTSAHLCLAVCSPAAMPLSVESNGRSDNWRELLLDLFYVAFLIKLGNIFLDCQLSGAGYLFAVSHFLGVYMAKFELDQYLNKFGQRDFLHNAFVVLYFVGLFISILNINDTHQVTRWPS